MNKSDQDRTFRISIESSTPGLELRDNAPVPAKAEAVVAVPVVLVARDGASGRKDVRFIVESEDGSTRKVVDSSFFGPM